MKYHSGSGVNYNTEEDTRLWTGLKNDNGNVITTKDLYIHARNGSNYWYFLVTEELHPEDSGPVFSRAFILPCSTKDAVDFASESSWEALAEMLETRGYDNDIYISRLRSRVK